MGLSVRFVTFSSRFLLVPVVGLAGCLVPPDWLVRLKRSNACSLFQPYVVLLLGIINSSELLVNLQVIGILMCGSAPQVFGIHIHSCLALFLSSHFRVSKLVVASPFVPFSGGLSPWAVSLPFSCLLAPG